MKHLNRIITFTLLILAAAGVYAQEATYDCEFASPKVKGSVSFILDTDSVSDTPVMTIKFNYATGKSESLVYKASKTRYNYRDILGSPLYTFSTTGEEGVPHSLVIIGDKKEISLVYKEKSAKSGTELGANIPYTASTWETIEGIITDFAARTVK